MTTTHPPVLSPLPRGLLRTVAELGRPSTVDELVSRCNPRPVTTSETEVLRWRERGDDLRRAVAELCDAGLMAQTVEGQGGQAVRVVWLT